MKIRFVGANVSMETDGLACGSW